VIAVAGGEHKTAAVRSVLISGHANSLVTDTALARELLSGL
jgi:DNA-binding transcriptional regulator LsrR (DeoR family)